MIEIRTISDAIFDDIKKRILSGNMCSGDRIIQDDFGAQYGASRIPLREALQQLKAEGLVASLPHRGSQVATLTPEEVANNIRLRVVIECDLLRCSLPMLTNDVLDEAENIMMNHTTVTEYGLGQLNWKFHKLLYSGVVFPTSLKIAELLHMGVDSYARNQRIIKTNYTEGTYLLIGMCKDRRVDDAVKQLEKNITEETAYELPGQ